MNKKNSSFYLLLILFMPFLASCSLDGTKRQLALESVTAPYAAGAVNIQLIAEPGLNAWKGMSNSVAILVIQASNETYLENILSDKTELRALFNGAATRDKPLKIDRYMLMPGQQHTLHIDRAESARQVAVVAGYYPFPGPGHITRFSVPVSAYKKQWWNNDWQAKLTPLRVAITMGNSSIVQISGAENLHVNLSHTQENN
ncbi:type VI secretion lipoprotein TssJ [Buttiauxella gaviniae]|jgi:type VI secretion system VasD/TssJ family lipoprotein|uniref:type VI secretion lipoprotein TssJ n=1 Tax=Buttiauxella gaviniae TaxID=82990 RepID=UPI0039771454